MNVGRLFIDLKKGNQVKVKHLLERLQQYNPEAQVSVIAFCRPMKFTLTYGGSDGCPPAKAESVSFYVDELCHDETGVCAEDKLLKP